MRLHAMVSFVPNTDTRAVSGAGLTSKCAGAAAVVSVSAIWAGMRPTRSSLPIRSILGNDHSDCYRNSDGWPPRRGVAFAVSRPLFPRRSRAPVFTFMVSRRVDTAPANVPILRSAKVVILIVIPITLHFSRKEFGMNREPSNGSATTDCADPSTSETGVLSATRLALVRRVQRDALSRKHPLAASLGLLNAGLILISHALTAPVEKALEQGNAVSEQQLARTCSLNLPLVRQIDRLARLDLEFQAAEADRPPE
jgi:hypothetical protein